jgi:thioredoxin reductase
LLRSLRIKNVKTGEEDDLKVNGLFYAIGKSVFSFLVGWYL